MDTYPASRVQLKHTSARSSPRHPTSFCVWVIPGALLLPSVPLYMDIASSLAMGTAILALLLIALAWSTGRSQNRGVSARSIALLTVLILLGIQLHLAVAASMMPVDVGRAVASMVLLVIVLMGGHAMFTLIRKDGEHQVDRAVSQAFNVLCLVALAAVLGIAPPTGHSMTKPVFPFTEPSHFAIGFVPILMYRCVTTSTLRRLLWLASGLVIALVLENLTLVAGCLLVAFVSLRLQLVLLLIAFATLLALQIDLTYYSDRLDLSPETQNLSSLAFLQGWQLIVESWGKTDGWGLGFQQLGLQGTNVNAAELIEAIAGMPLNVHDGSFTASKLVSEFGIFGVVLLLVYLFLAVRSVIFLRRASSGGVAVLAHCILVAYGLELGLRGSGYFTGGVLLVMSALWLLAADRRTRRSVEAASLVKRVGET